MVPPATADRDIRGGRGPSPAAAAVMGRKTEDMPVHLQEETEASANEEEETLTLVYDDFAAAITSGDSERGLQALRNLVDLLR